MKLNFFTIIVSMLSLANPISVLAQTNEVVYQKILATNQVVMLYSEEISKDKESKIDADKLTEARKSKSEWNLVPISRVVQYTLILKTSNDPDVILWSKKVKKHDLGAGFPEEFNFLAIDRFNNKLFLLYKEESNTFIQSISLDNSKNDSPILLSTEKSAFGESVIAGDFEISQKTNFVVNLRYANRKHEQWIMNAEQWIVTTNFLK